MIERRFDSTEEAWRLVAPAPPAELRVPRESFEVAVLEQDGRGEIAVYADASDATLAALGADRIEALVHVWADRYAELAGRPEVEYVEIVENRGQPAALPHFRLHSYPEIPPRARRKLELAQDRLAEHGRCVYCDVAAREDTEGARVVAATDSFIAFVPFATRFSHEVQVLSRRHAPSLLDLTDPERASLAEVLDAVFRGYVGLLGESLPYVMAVHQAPTDDGRWQPVSHFQIELAPAASAAPDIGAGVFVVDRPPEGMAAELRAAAAR